MVPLLPHMFEQRMGLDASLTQRYTSVFLAEGAFISIVSSPFVGSIADKTRSKKNLLLLLLGLALISVLCLSWTPSCTSVVFLSSNIANCSSVMGICWALFPMPC